MLELPILSINIFIPFFSAIYIAFFTKQHRSPRKQKYPIYVGILSSALTLLCSLYLFFKFNAQESFQFVERYTLIPQIGLEFHVGIDGISLIFILLTSLLTTISLIASLHSIKKQIPAFLVCVLLIESFCIGAFSSMNLLLFYIFFESMLIPMYIIIGIWGGENRIYASVKFFLYTFFGSILFLISLIYIYANTNDLSIQNLISAIANFSLEQQKLLWWAIFVCFAIKFPLVPFHSWLPDAHVQAPTAGSVILAGILLKLGGYGFLRILLPIFPIISEEYSYCLLVLSAVSIIYASLIAFAQTDMKKMIAYSSIAHMGYVSLGLFTATPEGIKGSIFQMFSHGLVTSALFLIVGVFYDRCNTKDISRFGGVSAKAPKLALFFMISVLASIGLPGTSGFIGELFVIFASSTISWPIATIASFGILFSAVYMLHLYRQVMLGKIHNSEIESFEDLNYSEIISIAPLCILIICLGFAPNLILKLI